MSSLNHRVVTLGHLNLRSDWTAAIGADVDKAGTVSVVELKETGPKYLFGKGDSEGKELQSCRIPLDIILAVAADVVRREKSNAALALSDKEALGMGGDESV